ncbi:insulinase family protein [Paraglaciecola sp. 2405UD69-4]|uniref:insulinase family protein n=1 Tax=Paraglaciecola sp. 2405UD69-4 TaxID=3391836 RepID=UPI0039C8CC3E
MLKSAYDNRQYKYTELANGLKVLLIQDKYSAKSACSITINAGHFQDDQDCQGLSHLLEHMLFSGNHQFPFPNEFADYLANYNGTINASTGTEFTSYFYELNNDNNQIALVHLFAMIVKPKFHKSFIEKEISAIDAEFSLKQKDDLRRLYQVHKETCNPAHPFSKFSVGNKSVFSEFSLLELQQKLLKFHQRFYQPQNASLCLITPHDISTSEDLVQSVFTEWLNSPKVPVTSYPDLYLPENLGIKINIKPIQHAQRMILTFPLPGQGKYFRSKPLSVLSHIFGDEGDNGLLSFYKQKNWATSLTAGGGVEGSNFKDFNINLQLTDEGVKNQQGIVSALFSFIQLIKSEGVSKWRIEEVSTLNKLDWDFSDRLKPIDEVQQLGTAMFEFPEKYLLCGDYVLDCPDQVLTEKMLGYFCPSNLRVKLVSPDANTELISKWYNTPYSVKTLDTNITSETYKLIDTSSLKLPEANSFLQPPSPLKKINPKYQLPHKIVNKDGLELWYGQDNQFKQPKGNCFLTFDCPAINQGVDIIAGKRLWVALLNERLNQKYYQADIAGIHFHFYPHQGGFSIQTSGLSHPQLSFCSKLLNEIIVHDDFTKSFERVKSKQLHGLSNTLLNKPINRLFSRLAVLIQEQNYSPELLAFHMEQFNLGDIKQTKEKLLNSFHLEGLMYGDWSYSDAERVALEIEDFRNHYTTTDKIKRGVAQIIQLPTHTHYVECEHPDSAAVIYFQAPNSDLKTTALTMLTEQLLAAPFFQELRTVQQLGYLVGTGYVPYNNHPGIGFYVQSPHKNAGQLINAINTFLLATADLIDEYQKVWQMLKNGVIKQFIQQDANLNMKSQRLWMAIGNGNDSFDQKESMLRTINELEFIDIKNYFLNMVARHGFGEFVLYSGDLTHLTHPANAIEVSAIASFKKSAHYL